jgi:SAM-dependent methyltransferase
MKTGPDLSKIEAEMRGVYERQASHWHEKRRRDLYERGWLERFLEGLPANGNLLDLGCGTGQPIAAHFLAGGFDVTGIDYSSAMIALARSGLPEAAWHIKDMRTLTGTEIFDGICSWDAFFHLSIADQRQLLPVLAWCVRENGAILLTVGPGEGEVTGTVGGELVYHASLSPQEYRQILSDAGFSEITLVPEDQSVAGRSVVLGRKRHVATL